MNAHALSSRRRPGTMRTHRSRRSSTSSEAAPAECICRTVTFAILKLKPTVLITNPLLQLYNMFFSWIRC